MRRLGQYLLANPLHAMAIALLCALLPLVSLPGEFFAGILIGFVTLCRGFKAGFWILIGVAIPTLAMAIWKHVVFIELGLVRWALVWMLAGILRTTISWRLILEIMTIIGVLTVLGFYLILGDVSGWWTTTLNHFQPVFNAVLSGQVSAEKLELVIAQMAPIASGLFTGLVLLEIFCQLLLARWWQASLFRPGGLAKEFVEIRSGVILAVLATLTVLGAAFGAVFAIDLLPVVILPLAVSGLSLVHKWARYNRKIVYLLVIIYLGIIFLPVILIAILALAGYIDTWWDLRKHYLINT